MDSDSNSSLHPPSTDLESFQLYKRGELAKAVWVYTRMGHPNTTENPKHHYCLECEKANIVPIYSTPVSTNQRNHLKSAHSIIVELLDRELSPLTSKVSSQLQQLYLRVESSGQASEFDTTIFQKHLHRATINEALISLIVMHSLPFRIVK